MRLITDPSRRRFAWMLESLWVRWTGGKMAR